MGEYLNEQGYIRLWDKRASGDTVSIVYEFDRNKLIMTESHVKPEDVEIEETKKAFKSF